MMENSEKESFHSKWGKIKVTATFLQKCFFIANFKDDESRYIDYHEVK